MSVDVFVALLAAGGFYYGYVRGILQGLFTVVVYLLGVFAAMWCTPIVNEALREGLGLHDRWTVFAAFAFAFALFFLVFLLFRRTAQEQFKGARVNQANRIGGAFLMSFFFVLLGSGLIKFAYETGLLSERTARLSRSYPVVRRLPELTYSVLRGAMPMLRDFARYVEENVSEGETGPMDRENVDEQPTGDPLQ
jgi:hypothetical protein